MDLSDFSDEEQASIKAWFKRHPYLGGLLVAVRALVACVSWLVTGPVIALLWITQHVGVAAIRLRGWMSRVRR